MSDKNSQTGAMPPLGKASKGNIILAGNSKVSLDICVMDRYGYANTLSLQSFVERVNHDNSFLIQMPVYQNSHYPLRSDEVCLMYFTAELEKSGLLETFVVPVCFTDKIRRGNCVYARMRPLGNIEQCQYRDCYRFPFSMFVSLRRISGKNMVSARARMLDFSDGNMLLTTYENLKVEETLILDFDIDGYEAVEGVVLRTEPAGYGRRGFEASIKFNITDRKQKQRFYRFIVEKQLERKQRQSLAASRLNLY